MRSRFNSGRWMKEEHDAFLHGVVLYKKNWDLIATVVKTRSVVQVRTHGQKYFNKLQKGEEFPQEPYTSMYDVDVASSSSPSVSAPPSFVAVPDNSASPPTLHASSPMPQKGVGGGGGDGVSVQTFGFGRDRDNRYLPALLGQEQTRIAGKGVVLPSAISSENSAGSAGGVVLGSYQHGGGGSVHLGLGFPHQDGYEGYRSERDVSASSSLSSFSSSSSSSSSLPSSLSSGSIAPLHDYSLQQQLQQLQHVPVYHDDGWVDYTAQPQPTTSAGLGPLEALLDEEWMGADGTDGVMSPSFLKDRIWFEAL